MLKDISDIYKPSISFLLKKIEDAYKDKPICNAIYAWRPFSVKYLGNGVKAESLGKDKVMIYIDLSKYTVPDIILKALNIFASKTFTADDLSVVANFEYRTLGFIEKYPLLIIDLTESQIYRFKSDGKKYKIRRANNFLDYNQVLIDLQIPPKWIEIVEKGTL